MPEDYPQLPSDESLDKIAQDALKDLEQSSGANTPATTPEATTLAQATPESNNLAIEHFGEVSSPSQDVQPTPQTEQQPAEITNLDAYRQPNTEQASPEVAASNEYTQLPLANFEGLEKKSGSVPEALANNTTVVKHATPENTQAPLPSNPTEQPTPLPEQLQPAA